MPKGGSTTQTTRIDPDMMAMHRKLFSRAENAADQPFQPYTGERVAGMTPQHEQALSQMQNQAGLLGGGLDQAYQTAQAGLDPNVRDVLSRDVADVALNPYMNPFTGGVIDSAMGDLDRARQMAIGDTEDAAIGAGAYGGSRHGVADALTNEGFARQAADLAGNLRLQGYDRATQLAQGDINRDVETQRLNQGADFNREQLQRAAASGLINLGLGGTDRLSQAGDFQRDIDQARNDVAFQEFMRQQGEPIQDIGLLSSVLSGMPVGHSTTQTQQRGLGGRLAGGLGGAAAGGLLAGSLKGAEGGAMFGAPGIAAGAGLGALMGLL